MKLKNNIYFLLAWGIYKVCNAELNLNQNDYQVKFERAEMVHYNKEYIKDCSFKTFKYNRSIAVVNATITPNVDLGNSVEVLVQVYKFLSNEYRIFPIHFQANACKAFAADVYGVKSGYAKCGNIISCPLHKAIRYYGCNLYPDQSKLPPLIPNGQYKTDLQILYSSTEIGLASLYTTISRPIV